MLSYNLGFVPLDVVALMATSLGLAQSFVVNSMRLPWRPGI